MLADVMRAGTLWSHLNESQHILKKKKLKASYTKSYMKASASYNQYLPPISATKHLAQ
jgi:hypothetical protein